MAIENAHRCRLQSPDVWTVSKRKRKELQIPESTGLTEQEETSMLVTHSFTLPRFSSSFPMWS